jgi:hypothetical protein
MRKYFSFCSELAFLILVNDLSKHLCGENRVVPGGKVYCHAGEKFTHNGDNRLYQWRTQERNLGGARRKEKITNLGGRLQYKAVSMG